MILEVGFMKKNLPVTDREVTLSESQTIISSTDLKGAITNVNQDFLDISGYASEELLGKNHNIVRHPDIPPAAFEDLWNTLKTGKAWMGLVKNRCKSGDYYWVDAFVTPVTKNGQVQGYESTRVKPIKALTERAGKLYKDIYAGKKLKLKSLSFKLKQIITGSSLQFVLFAALALMGFITLPVAVSSWLIGSIAWAGITHYQMRDFSKLLMQSKTIVDNPIMQLAYYGKVDDISQLRLSTRILYAKLRTVIKRTEDSIDQMSKHAQMSSEIISSSSTNVNRQKQELEMVATAVSEMTAAIQEVA